MVMMGWQDDGTMGPNINTSILPAKPGSTAALAQQKLQNRQSAGQQASTPKEETPGTGANRGAVGSLGTSIGI